MELSILRRFVTWWELVKWSRIVRYDKTGNFTLGIDETDATYIVSSGSAVVATIPLNSAVPIPINEVRSFINVGAGTLSFTASGGVTLRNSSVTLAQYKTVAVAKIGLDEWIVLI